MWPSIISGESSIPSIGEPFIGELSIGDPSSGEVPIGDSLEGELPGDSSRSVRGLFISVMLALLLTEVLHSWLRGDKDLHLLLHPVEAQERGVGRLQQLCARTCVRAWKSVNVCVCVYMCVCVCVCVCAYSEEV